LGSEREDKVVRPEVGFRKLSDSILERLLLLSGLYAGGPTVGYLVQMTGPPCPQDSTRNTESRMRQAVGRTDQAQPVTNRVTRRLNRKVENMHPLSQHLFSATVSPSRIGARRFLTGPAAVALVLTPLLIAGNTGPVVAGRPGFDRVSVSSTGGQGDQPSGGSAAMSGDARYVTFHSSSSNLVPGDTNGVVDIFLRDRQARTTTRISMSGTEAQADGPSISAAVSGDGRHVAFLSDASNLVPGDTNGIGDVFVRDVRAGTTSRVNVSDSGVQANTGPNNDGYSGSVTISADGRYVAFHSGASNLVPGDTNDTQDVFVHDRHTARTVRASVTHTGTQSRFGGFNPALSADGRHIAYLSDSSDLVRGDTNGIGDVFVRDLSSGSNSRVSLTSTDRQTEDGETYRAYVALSADGQNVAFTSNASTLVPDDTNRRYDVFLRDRRAGTTHRISVSTTDTQADADSESPLVISADGRHVAFPSDATNLVPGDTNGMSDVFIRDWRHGTTRLASGADTTTYPYNTGDPAISANGRHIAFTTTDPSLVPGDTNGAADVFVSRQPR
jgi:Tol biopolymer transport system component